MLTLITYIENQPKYRRCIQAVEKDEEIYWKNCIKSFEMEKITIYEFSKEWYNAIKRYEEYGSS